MSTLALSVRVDVDRRTLVWAASYMLHHGYSVPYLMKADFLSFLRNQIGQFGTDSFTLMGENWETDFAKEIPLAEVWVSKRFPEVK